MVNGHRLDVDAADVSFTDLLRQRAEDRKSEYFRLIHEQKRMGIRLERLKASIQHLNGVLEDEGLPTIPLKEPSETGFAKPGNRSAGMPLRKPEWDGMSLTQSVETILNETIDTVHADLLVTQIYEIETEAERKKAKHTLVSVLREGARKNLWLAFPRNQYRGTAVRQQELVGV